MRDTPSKVNEEINMSTETVEDTGMAWETGDLGRDESSVRVSTETQERAVEETLGLQMISLRLQKELIEQLKFLAKYHGIGYQPMIRDVLTQWGRSEMLLVANQMQQQLQARETIEANKGQCA
jgi:predicted DNA binding CopG/RHH family protein